MANYAGEDGLNCFPSIATLARNSRLSGRSVQRHITKLLETGLIRKGNQNIAAALIGRADRRPVVYDLMIPRGVTQSPRSTDGVTPKTSRGDRRAERGDTAVSTDPPSRSSIKPKSAKSDFREEYKQRFGYYPGESLAGPPAQQKKV
jgi:Helix-turn-helix domain